MDEIEVFEKLNEITEVPQFSLIFSEDSVHSNKVENHKTWLQTIRHERPNTTKHQNVAIYIRYFNQTKYENYLEYHKKQFTVTIGQCLNWNLFDFYIDEGATAPNMETAPEWSRLLNDCYEGKVDLIITQKISNVSKKIHEITLCARLLASLKKPVGIYFISEDIYTLASYYKKDNKDEYFLPTPDWKLLPDDND
ncbi:MAG: recombinase family protein [Clostridia bacterium]|nr:recombinase family protein [Clostridia bacterium]